MLSKIYAYTKRPAGNPYYDPSKSHHRPYGFVNPPGSPRRDASSVALSRVAKEFIRAKSQTPRFDDSHVIPQHLAKQQYAQLQDVDSITWLGHAAFLIKLNQQTFLTDPFLGNYAAPLPTPGLRRLFPPGIAINQLPRIDWLLISHNHYDHLDAPTLRTLACLNPQLRVVAPLGLGKHLQSLGFTRIEELDWYESIVDQPIQLTALPAIHFSGRTALDRNQTLWAGFSIRSDSQHIYFAGDTAYGPLFKDIGQRMGPFDLGLVPIGAYAPRSIMVPVHANPEEAVAIGCDIGARELIGMHWGTIQLTTEAMDEPAQRFLAHERPIKKSIMAIGESKAL